MLVWCVKSTDGNILPKDNFYFKTEKLHQRPLYNINDVANVWK